MTNKGLMHYREFVSSAGSKLTGKQLLEFLVLKQVFDSDRELITRDNIITNIQKTFDEYNEGQEFRVKGYMDDDIIRGVQNLIKSGMLQGSGPDLGAQSGYYELHPDEKAQKMKEKLDEDLEKMDKKIFKGERHKIKAEEHSEDKIMRIEVEGISEPLYLTENELQRLRSTEYLNLWIEGRRYCPEYVPAYPLLQYKGTCMKYIQNKWKHCRFPGIAREVCKTGENSALKDGDKIGTLYQRLRMKSPKIRESELSPEDQATLVNDLGLDKDLVTYTDILPDGSEKERTKWVFRRRGGIVESAAPKLVESGKIGGLVNREEIEEMPSAMSKGKVVNPTTPFRVIDLKQKSKKKETGESDIGLTEES